MKNKYYLFLFAVSYLLLFTISNADSYQAAFTPRISVSEEYTDNYFLTDDNKEHEYITIASIGFIAEVLGRSNGMSISYDPSYSWHDRYSDNDAWSHRAVFDCWIGISRNTRLEINDTFLHTEEPVTEIEDFTEVDTSIRRSRRYYYTNSSGVELSHQFGESDSVSLGFVYSFLKNDDPDIEDNKRYNPSMNLTYWFIPHKWGLELNGSYTRGEFDVSNDFDNWFGSLRLLKGFTRHFDMFVQYDHTYMDYIQGITNNYHIYNPSAGFNYSVAEDINLYLNVGYYVLDTENVSNDETDGVSAEGEIEKIFERGSIHITGSGGYDESFFGAENLGTDKYYESGCTADYAFTRYISGDIYGFYRRDKYIELSTERKDKTTRAGAALTLHPLRWMSLRFEYSYRTVDSSIDTNDYEENRGLITLTLSPSEPIRLTE
ncbi:MAG: hypothetical protein DRH21_04910 [Deltaproteobacteria bacterium]|nr:MAG: hypothetical protein DRH21_04910 [Deltaproteobacteria bacterium]